MNLSLHKLVDCPYCWKVARKRDLLQRCSPACGSDWAWLKPGDVRKGECPHGRAPVRRRFCTSCKRPLTREYIDNQGKNIAIIGAPQAGKSTYVGVLVHHMRSSVSPRFNGMALDFLGDASQTLYEERYESRLFHERLTLAPTPRAVTDDVNPLIFALKFPQKRSVKSAVTVFYDTSGENVLTADAMDPLTRYLERAGGIILLVDPHTLTGKDTLTAGGRATGMTDQIAVIRRLGELLREGRRKGGGKLRTPLAVAITKIDEFRHTFDPESPVRRTSLHSGHFDESDARDLHEEMRGWLDRRCGPELDATLTANFSAYRYFALSSLGAAPTSGQLASQGIHPYRVEDPVLWLLSRFGAIRTVARSS